MKFCSGVVSILRHLWLVIMKIPYTTVSAYEPRTIIRFLITKGKTVKEIHQEIPSVMNIQMVCRWQKYFFGRTRFHPEWMAWWKNVFSNPGGTVDRVRATVGKDERLIINQLSSNIEISLKWSETLSKYVYCLTIKSVLSIEMARSHLSFTLNKSCPKWFLYIIEVY